MRDGNAIEWTGTTLMSKPKLLSNISLLADVGASIERENYLSKALQRAEARRSCRRLHLRSSGRLRCNGGVHTTVGTSRKPAER